jgi:hypothetical protein
MRRTLQLAAAALLLLAGAQGRAQIHLYADKPPAEDLSWLWKYAEPAPNGNETALLADVRFKPLLDDHLKAPQTFWSKSKSLPDTIVEYLKHPRAVVSEANRYLTATGCVEEFCPNRGMLWIDLGSAHPLVVFAATNWVAENKATDQSGATYTLWVFTSRTLDAAHLPKPLARSIAPWLAEPVADGTVEQIANVILVDPDGSPHQIQPADIGIDPTKQQTEQKAHS